MKIILLLHSSFNLKKGGGLNSVLKSLNGVKVNKVTGIDKISNRILKMAAPACYLYTSY